MIEYLLLLLAPVNYTPAVAVRAAYVAQRPVETVAPEHCGACVGGVITHADGHKTPCPCPPTCPCKK